MRKQKFAFDLEWAMAKKLCRLNQDDIRMAKQLGFKPRSLIKNIPNKNQKWKEPVKQWIHRLYKERFGVSLHNKQEHDMYQRTPSQVQMVEKQQEKWRKPEKDEDQFSRSIFEDDD